MCSFAHAADGASRSRVRELRDTDESLSELQNSLMHFACRPWDAHLLRLPLVICLKEEAGAIGAARNGAVFCVGLRVVLGSARACGRAERAHTLNICNSNGRRWQPPFDLACLAREVWRLRQPGLDLDSA